MTLCGAPLPGLRLSMKKKTTLPMAGAFALVSAQMCMDWKLPCIGPAKVAILVMTARDAKSLAQAARKLRSWCHRAVQTCDYAVPNSDAFCAGSSLHRPLDFLINNAGIAHPIAQCKLPYPRGSR